MTEGELAAGRDVGPYRLLFRLGRGGMGEVWAAERRGPSGFAKILALKLLPAPDLDRNTVVMFFDEARAASALDHPAIVRTFDLGRDGELAYIAMELVRGPSLNALLQELAINRRSPMSPAIVAYIGERVASALEHAYLRATIDDTPLRLVHRDVSPQNILLDTSGNVQLSDFGIARTAVQEHRTQADIFRGKPGYMSPEQAMAKPLDDRSDLFALAIVLYECATLRRLFGRKTTRESFEALAKNAPHPIPALVPGFPEPLWRLLQQALEKDRELRQHSIAEVVVELRELGRSLPGYTTAGRDLSALIAASFEGQPFDIDARVNEARAMIPVTWPSVVANTDTWPDAPLESMPPKMDTMPEARAFPSPSVQSVQIDAPRPPSSWRAAVVAIVVFAVAIGLILGINLGPPSTPRVIDPAQKTTAALPPTRPAVRALTRTATETATETAAAIAPEPPKKVIKRAAPDASAPVEVPEPTPPTEADAWRMLGEIEGRDATRAGRLRAKFVEAKASGDAAQMQKVIEEIIGTGRGS